jgi:hypothetical protein
LDTLPSLERYFRFPGGLPFAKPNGDLSSSQGFFRFGPDTICFGRCSKVAAASTPGGQLEDLSRHVHYDGVALTVPFDVDEVVRNLREERYVGSSVKGTQKSSLTRDLYYLARPMMPLGFRKYLQQIYLRGWDKLPFPKWPVDRSVDRLLEGVLRSVLRSSGNQSFPFIWFWPEGANACAIMTHDVEEAVGRDFCSELMNIDKSFGIPASFQIVPEVRYSVGSEFLQEIRTRGFEVNIQDLNHDGRLFLHRKEFERRVKLINDYGKSFQAVGFRSAILYRNQAWFDLLEFEYDMSVPSVAHLDPQRGGCCTIMPYFVGGLVELPVTASQDHTLFNILNDFSLDLWRQQTEIILKHHGLMNFIVHPDYVTGKKEQDAFRKLLASLANLRDRSAVWIALPRDVNRWWRMRDRMTLTREGGAWAIQGEGSERARVAFASLQDDQLVYSFTEPSKAANGPRFKNESIGKTNGAWS